MSNCYTFPSRVYGATRYCERYMPRDRRIVIIVLNNRGIDECYLRCPEDQTRVDALHERFNTLYI